MERGTQSGDNAEGSEEAVMGYKIYVSNDNRVITGSIHGIRYLEKAGNGMVITFSNRMRANHAMRVLRDSGYAEVRALWD